MNDTGEPGGLAARFLDRAEGRVTALRPGLPHYFNADQARDGPMIERSDEIPAAPVMTQETSRETPAPRETPTRLVAAAPADPFMPPAAVHILPDTDHPLVAADEVPADPVPAALANPAAGSERPGIRPDSRLIPPRQNASASDPVARHRGDSLSAAVIQLLGTETPEPSPPVSDGQAFPPEFETRLASRAPALPELRRPETERDRAEPALSIHIGEIVIAPEPTPAARTERPAQPAWQPPLVLAEYRAARAKERR